MVIPMHLQTASRAALMLRITTEKKRGKTFLTVEGRLAGPWVAALEQCWRGVPAALARGKVLGNLFAARFIDAGGKALLVEIHRQGGQLVAGGWLHQTSVHEIVAREKRNGG